MRAAYEINGSFERTNNFFNHSKKLPVGFWEGSTGIEPVDTVIKRVLETGYCHHIERLMVLGNFLLLTETDPDEVYNWFMGNFVDAYDWVMVPNVYGMSQYADEGFMTTKPYVSGSNYILKMSNFKKGSWCDIWDGLFWRFLKKHQPLFLKNPRMSVLVKYLDKEETLVKIKAASKWLENR
jgi:deoxyribodipyrimidine photolyase-related protein